MHASLILSFFVVAIWYSSPTKPVFTCLHPYTMACAVFHHFPMLPWELRDLIWDISIRPDQPGAHFFTVFSPSIEENKKAMEVYSMKSAYGATELAASRCSNGKADRSWTTSNPSTYLIDSGLWTACKESRERMEHRFQTER